MKSLFFSRGKESYEPNLIFCIIMRNNICNTSFYSYEIPKSVSNEIIFFTFK